MTKKIIGLLTMVFISTASIQAQKDTVIIEMDGATVEVEPGDTEVEELVSLIREGARESQRILARQRERMNTINKRLASGEISREEAERQRRTLVEETELQLEELESEMEEAGDQLGERMEKRMEEEIEKAMAGEDSASGFAQKWEAEARAFERKREKNGPIVWDFGDDEDDDSDEDDWEWDEEWDKKKKNQKPTNFIFDFHLGFNTLLDADGNMLENEARLDNWRSNIYEIGFHGKTRLGKTNSKAYIKYGLSFTWHDWTLRGGNVITKDSLNGGSVAFVKAEENVRHSEWRSAFVNIPIMFQLDLSERGMDNGFTLGVGGYGGLRMYSLREIKYNDFADDRVTDKNYNNYFMNNWRYGLLAQIGFNSFKITAQYDMNPLFRTDHAPVQGDLNNLSMTLGWSF